MRSPDTTPQDSETDKPALDAETFSSNRAATPIPYLSGEGGIAARWISVIHGSRAEKKATGGGGKGGKGGGMEKTVYYGIIAGAICEGPVEAITGILESGKIFWEGVHYRETSSSPLVIDIPDRGTITFYWGTETQGSDSKLSLYESHPAYRGICYFVFDGILDLNGGTNAPNLKFFVRRKSQQSIITGTPSAFNGWFHSNAATVAAELLTHWSWAALPSAQLIASSFQSVADELQAEPAASTDTIATAIAPLWNEGVDIGAALEKLAQVSGAVLRFAPDGKIECKRWKRNAASTVTCTELGWFDLESVPQYDGDDIEALPNSYVVQFRNGQSWHHGDGLTIDNSAILNRPGATRVQKAADYRDLFNTEEQARRWAQEMVAKAGLPVLQIKVSVRSEKAKNPDGSDIRPGDYFKAPVTLDPQASVVEAVLFRCIARTFEAFGPVDLIGERELDAPITPASAISPEPGQASLAQPPVALQRIVSLPPLATEDDNSVCALVCRPHDAAGNCEVTYSDSAGGDYQSLGRIGGFALPVTLNTSITTGAPTVRVGLLPNGANGQRYTRELHYLTEWSGGVAEGRDDQLLLVLATITAGEIAVVPSTNTDFVEVLSVSGPASIISSGVYDIPVYRGRLGTSALAFTSGAFSSVEGWIIPRRYLERLYHADFNTLVGTLTPGYFRFKPEAFNGEYDPATAWEERLRLNGLGSPLAEYAGQPDATTFAPTASFVFPDVFTGAPAAPTGLAASIGTGKIVELTWTNLVGAHVMRYQVFRATGPGYSDETLLTYDTDGRIHDVNVVVGTTYRYRVKAEAYDDQLSDFSASVTATPTNPTSAKVVTLTSSSQIFQYPKAGGVNPASITLTAVGQNLSGSPSFAVHSGTVTLAGSGSTRTIDPATMTTDTVTVRVDWDGQSDYISIAKVREGADGANGTNGTNGTNGANGADGDDAVTGFLTNEAHVLPSNVAGVVTSWANAFTDFKVYFGIVDDTANWSFARADGPNITSTISTNRVTITGLSVDTSYVDITASRSGFSSVVKRFKVTKSRTGLEVAPSDPAAPTLHSSGSSISQSGTVLSWLRFNIPAFPSGGQWLNCLYRVNGDSGWIMADQRSTGGGTLVIPDLSPGIAYEFAVQAFSVDGTGSNIITATGSPFTAPAKSTRPPAVTSLTTTAPVMLDGFPAAYDGAGRLYTGTWVTPPPPSSGDIVSCEVRLHVTGAGPADNEAIVPSKIYPINQGRIPVSGDISFVGSYRISYRQIDSSGNRGFWYEKSGISWSANYAGNMGSQNEDATKLSGVTTTQTGSGRKVKVRYPFNTLGSCSTAAEVTFNITIDGFSWKADFGSIGCASDGDMICRYDWDAAGNSSTNAVVKMKRRDGANVDGGTYRLTGVFEGY